MDSRPTRSVRSRKNRRQVVDQTLDMENNNSSSSLYNKTLDDSRFDDTPTNLYGRYKESVFLLILGTENIFDALHSLNCYAYCSV